QIGPSLEVSDRPLAAYILAQLDENGLLREAPAEIAVYKRATLRQVEAVLSLIQRADPPGVGARDPQHSLLIQLDALADAGRVPEGMARLASLLIEEHFEALGHMDYERIVRRLKADRGLRVTVGTIEAAVQFIHRNLTPYPAQAFWGDGKLPNGPDAT